MGSTTNHFDFGKVVSWTASAALAAALCSGAARAGDCEPGWVPTFGGPQNLGPSSLQGGSVDSMVAFDDGSGDGPALYVGGNYTSAGGAPANRIAKWNGTSWAPLDGGITGGIIPKVYALAVFDGDLYAGGSFTHADGTPASNIARWDGENWSTVGSGVNGQINALQVFDDGSGGGPALYVGGSFGMAGGSTALNIAKWSGSAWSAVGGGADAVVNALTVFDDGKGQALYAGGEFLNIGGNPANRIAKWNGLAWSALLGGTSGTVNALTVFDDGSGGGPALHVGGNFQTANGILARNVAKWNGRAWFNLHLGTNGRVRALKAFDDGLGDGPVLYAGGSFTTAGGANIQKVARWNGAAWSGQASIVNDDLSINVFEVFDDGSGDGPVLFVGGQQQGAISSSAPVVTRWTGSVYDSLGGGIDAIVRALLSHDDLQGDGPVLFAGGSFTTTGEAPALHVARWDGESWSPMGAGLPQPVSALAAFDDGSGDGPRIYAGMISGPAIARWNGTTWQTLPVAANRVDDMIVFDDGSGEALYVAGLFVVEGINNAWVFKFDGDTWTPLDPVAGQVFALEVFDDGSGGGPALYAGGEFQTAGGIEANRIAKWDGRDWSPLSIGMKDGPVNALGVYDDGGGPALYAGGGFEIAGFVFANGIAKWDGRNWSALDGGIDNMSSNDEVLSMTVFDDGAGGGPQLYVSGIFDEIGGIDALNIAKWNGRSWSPLSEGSPRASTMIVHPGEPDGRLALFVGGNLAVPGGDRFLGRFQGCLIPPPDADFDDNGVVDGIDLGILLAHWANPGGIADVNHDGVVDGIDLGILLLNWTL